MQKKITIGTRGSDLALWQAHHVKAQLESLNQRVELKIIKTKGDQIQHLSFDKIEGKGFFTKELEEELLNGNIDLAVHSHKDLETEQPKGLKISCVSEREDPADILLVKPSHFDPSKNLSLKSAAVVGTSSARRKTQLLAFRNDLQIHDLRGNVPTRIQKLREGKYDAIVLAAAGVKRLNIDVSDLKTVRLNPREFVAAPAQGVLALQIRESDELLHALLQTLNSASTQKEIEVERKVLNQMQGGCQLPLGVHCIFENGLFKAWAALGNKEREVRRAYSENANYKVIANDLLEKLKAQKEKIKIFVSKKITSDSLFNSSFLGSTTEVIGEPLIEFKGIDFTEVPPTEWIFFTSRNSARFFFKKNPDINGKKIACVGEGTYREVVKHVSEISFVGKHVDIKKVGEDFVQAVGNEKVLFPVSNITRRTIQQFFKNPMQTLDFPTYETVENNNIKLPYCEVLVFTSPSSVRAYFTTNKIENTQQVVAIGLTTGKELELFGVKNYSLPKTTGEIGLIDAVLALSNVTS